MVNFAWFSFFFLVVWEKKLDDRMWLFIHKKRNNVSREVKKMKHASLLCNSCWRIENSEFPIRLYYIFAKSQGKIYPSWHSNYTSLRMLYFCDDKITRETSFHFSHPLLKINAIYSSTYKYSPLFFCCTHFSSEDRFFFASRKVARSRLFPGSFGGYISLCAPPAALNDIHIYTYSLARERATFIIYRIAEKNASARHIMAI